MRSLGERLNLLRKLINLKCGPGAAVLPPTVSRIHMDFAKSLKGGHMGPRKFWREILPSLKFHNPSIPMIVNRHENNDQPPLLTIYFRDADAAATASVPIDSSVQPGSSSADLSKAQPPAAGERVVHLDMKDKHSSHILEYFLAETRAVPLKATPEEVAEMQDLEAMKKQAVVDRARINSIKEEAKREADMLKRAREMGGMSDES